jgi:glycosyltransferase involved in cell wall biosynthesis
LFTKRIAIVSVINDLVTDNRVLRTAEVLSECGYEVILVGRRLPRSLPVPSWPYRSIRMGLLFKKGPLFYLFFNLRLFFLLLFRKADLLVGNDLDTLLPNFLVSRLRSIPFVYDSHELFCEVPELQHTRFKKKIWEALEKMIVPKLEFCITVNQSIARIFEKKYGTKFHVVRNVSTTPDTAKRKSRKELNLPEDCRIILLQGAGINIDRGAEELVDAMQHINNALLLVIGSGDVWTVLEKKIKDTRSGNNVRLISKLPKPDLIHYTLASDLGISIDKPTNLNYLYSLPNKIFDYIHAGLPVLVSRLPEIEHIVTTYRIGEFIDNHKPEHIARRIDEMLGSGQLSKYRENCTNAAKYLNWETEKQILKSIFGSVAGKT